MNPKTVNDLDPKLKETYERIMGTSFPAASTQTTNQPQNQTPVVNTPPAPDPVAQQPVQTDPPPMMQPTPVTSDPMQASQIFRAGDPFQAPSAPPADLIAKANMSAGVVAPEPQQKKKSKAMPILLGLGGIIFFIAYGVIWAKVFGLF